MVTALKMVCRWTTDRNIREFQDLHGKKGLHLFVVDCALHKWAESPSRDSSVQAGTSILSQCIASVPGLTPAQKSI